MGKLNSFEEILKEKIKSSLKASPILNSNFSTQNSTDPSHMAYLLGLVSKFKSPPPQFKYKPSEMKIERKAHILDADQRLAFDFLNRYGTGLQDHFTKKDLKKAYRLAALKTHPDVSGDSQLFMELKKHYAALEKLFIPHFN